MIRYDIISFHAICYQFILAILRTKINKSVIKGLIKRQLKNIPIETIPHKEDSSHVKAIIVAIIKESINIYLHY